MPDDERRFEAYMDALADTLAHEPRIAALTGYCTGLRLPLERKTMETMAAHLAPERTLAMQHRLQDFITDAPWDDDAVLATVRAQVLPMMEERGAIRSWIVDDTSMPKKGKDSVGVARQYCGQLGRVDNCQSLVTLSLANATAALPIAARLYRRTCGRRMRSAAPRSACRSTSPSRPSPPSLSSRSARRTRPECRGGSCWPMKPTAPTGRSAGG